MTQRTVEIATMPRFYTGKWAHIRQILRVRRYVEYKDHCTFETVILITNAPEHRFTPRQLLAFNRQHWACESNHWIRDVFLREDASTTRSNHAPQNNAACNSCAITLLKRLFGNVTEGSQRAAHLLSKTINLLR